MSTLKVDGIRSNSATSDAITLASDGTCSANITSINNGSIGTKNLIINGAMTVAQRSENYLGVQSSSTASDYATVDRFKLVHAGTDEAPTQEQVDVAAGTTPYTLGFRKAFKITNGNQTSGAGASDNTLIRYKVEAQDIANSGWDYTSSSSNITLSFWVRSSVAQNFYGNFIAPDVTNSYNYAIETGSLTANTWTKITKTISGNSNLIFDNDNGVGLQMDLWAFAGTTYTDSGVTLNQWSAYTSGGRMPDNTSTWYTTNDATFEITGVQLEVGSTASAFSHETYGDTLRKCQRYLYKITMGINSVPLFMSFHRFSGSTGQAFHFINFPVQMRVDPDFTQDGTAYDATGYTGAAILYDSFKGSCTLKSTNSVAANGNLYLRPNNTSGTKLNLLFSAEL